MFKPAPVFISVFLFFSLILDKKILYYNILIRKRPDSMRKKIIILLFLLCLTVRVHGKTPDSDAALTLRDCFNASVKQSEELADKTELVIQAEERFKQARGAFLPSLVLSDTLSAEKGLGNPVTPLESDQTIRLGLNQPLFHGFKSISLYNQTKNLLTAGKEARKWTHLILYYDTAQSFYSVLGMRKDLEHLTNLISIYDRRIRELESWAKIGRIRKSDLLSAQTARALAFSQVKQAQGDLKNSEALFSFITGLDPATPLKEEDETDSGIPDLAECFGSMEKRPDIAASRERSLAAYQGIKIARSARWPWLDASTGLNLSKPLSGNELSWDIQVVLSFAIFSGNIISSRVSEAKSVARQSDLAFQSLIRKITNDIRISHQTLAAQTEQKTAVAEAVRFAERNYQQLESDYRLGGAKFTDVLAALSGWRDARRSHDRLLYAIRLAIDSGMQELP